MADRTKIEWTDATWNPTRGCSRYSTGCENCYAEAIAGRFSGRGQAYAGLALMKDVRQPSSLLKKEARWTGAVRFYPSLLCQPLDWKKPRRIFVDSMSDLFYERLETDIIDEIFAVMALADHHQFQVLTKRVARMCEYTNSIGATKPTETLVARVAALATNLAASRGKNVKSPYFDVWLEDWPLKHIWLGASAENQETYDARRRDLETTNAAVIWWSLEPLLGPIDLQLDKCLRLPDWIVVGGESGQNARPALHPDYVRRIRDDCVRHKIPFFFKQWGAWVTPEQNVCLFHAHGPAFRHDYVTDPEHSPECRNRSLMVFFTGKTLAGRKLDGVEWNQYPEAQPCLFK